MSSLSLIFLQARTNGFSEFQMLSVKKSIFSFGILPILNVFYDFVNKNFLV